MPPWGGLSPWPAFGSESTCDLDARVQAQPASALGVGAAEKAGSRAQTPEIDETAIPIDIDVEWFADTLVYRKLYSANFLINAGIGANRTGA
jgi:hypothetical protein